MRRETQAQHGTRTIHPLVRFEKGVAYLPAREIAAADNMRLPFITDCGPVLLDKPAAKSFSSLLPAWLDTGYAVGGANSVLPKGVDIVDSITRYTLPAEYVEMAARIGDLDRLNSGIIYNIAEVEQFNGRLIFHPYEIFVQQLLDKSGYGILDPVTNVAKFISPEEEKAINDNNHEIIIPRHKDPNRAKNLVWINLTWFSRPEGMVNRPMTCGDMVDFDGFFYFRSGIGGEWSIKDELGAGGVKIDGPLPRITFATLDNK